MMDGAASLVPAPSGKKVLLMTRLSTRGWAAILGEWISNLAVVADRDRQVCPRQL